MREIKFRGWSLTENRWVYGGVHFYEDRAIILEWRPKTFDFHNEVDPKSVGQFTGLLDKNGVEIYEGDILQFSDKWEWYRGEFGGGCLATQADKDVVETDHVQYPYERRKIEIPADYEWLLSSEIQVYWEVIGNIYANPDLLK